VHELSAHACSSIRAFDWGAWSSPVEAAMNDTLPHDTSGGAASANTVRCRSRSTVGQSGSHYIPGTCVPYPGLHGGGALGDASTPDTPSSSIAVSAHEGAYSHVAVAGGEARRGVPPPPLQRRRPAGVARHPREGPSLRRAAHLRTANGAVGTAHRRAGETDRARRGASNHAARWRQKPPTSRRNRSRRAGTIARGSSWARRTPDVAARGFWVELGRWGGAGGQGPSGPCDLGCRTVLLSHVLLTSKKWRLQREGRQSRHSIEVKSDWLFDKARSNYCLGVTASNLASQSTCLAGVTQSHCNHNEIS